MLANFYGGGDVFNETAREEFRQIKMDVMIQRADGERSYSEMWSRYRKRLLIAMSAQGFAQMNGINVISYYVGLTAIPFTRGANMNRLLWCLSKLAGLAAMLS